MKQRVRLCLFLASLILPSLATAGPTLTYDSTDTYVSGIRDLSINGTNYDVDFVRGSYLSLFTDATPPTFLNNRDGASAGEERIYGMLFSTFDRETGLAAELVGPSKSYILPYLYDAASGIGSALYDCHYGNWHRHYDGPPCLEGVTGPDLIDNGLHTVHFSGTDITTFAVLSAVPEPATLALLGIAFAGMGLVMYLRALPFEQAKHKA